MRVPHQGGTPLEVLGFRVLDEGSPLKSHKVTERVSITKRERVCERVTLSKILREGYPFLDSQVEGYPF